MKTIPVSVRLDSELHQLIKSSTKSNETMNDTIRQKFGLEPIGDNRGRRKGTKNKTRNKRTLKILDLFNKGMKVPQIQKKMKCTRQWIYALIRREGLSLNPEK